MSAHRWHTDVADEKKAQIVEAARALFLDVGYARATMSALAQRAGVSPTTLYKHFPEKDALFTAVLDALAAQFAEVLDSEDKRNASLDSQLNAFGLRYAGLLADPQVVAMARLVVAEAPLFPDIAARFFAALNGPVFHRLSALITAGIKAKQLRPHLPTDSMGQLLGYIERSVLFPRLLSPEHPRDPKNDARVVRLGVHTLITAFGNPIKD